MDIIILRAKYQAVNDFVAYCEKTADWLATRIPLAARTQEWDDLCSFVDEIVRIMLKTDAPGPALELIIDDLREVADNAPNLRFFRRLDEAEGEGIMQDLRARARPGQQVSAAEFIDLWVTRFEKLEGQLRTSSKVARLYRDRLTEQIEASGSPDRSTGLTPRERKLVEALGAKHLNGEELAVELGISYSGSFKSSLSSLVKRKILANDTTGYYVIAPPKGR
jgi:hypothetical protein